MPDMTPRSTGVVLYWEAGWSLVFFSPGDGTEGGRDAFLDVGADTEVLEGAAALEDDELEAVASPWFEDPLMASIMPASGLGFEFAAPAALSFDSFCFSESLPSPSSSPSNFRISLRNLSTNLAPSSATVLLFLAPVLAPPSSPSPEPPLSLSPPSTSMPARTSALSQCSRATSAISLSPIPGWDIRTNATRPPFDRPPMPMF
mmetsp:Transcript_33476/g.80926  ORF Transcript_33476/g.80926 Transcript_33476/m.80926 type:complete len:203 (-) Transcript_33476:451-1059(-)